MIVRIGIGKFANSSLFAGYEANMINPSRLSTLFLAYSAAIALVAAEEIHLSVVPA